MNAQAELAFTKAEITGQLKKSRINILYGVLTMAVGIALGHMGMPFGISFMNAGLAVVMSTVLNEMYARRTLSRYADDATISGKELSNIMQKSSKASRAIGLIAGASAAFVGLNHGLAIAKLVYIVLGGSTVIFVPGLLASRTENALVKSKLISSPNS